MAGLDLGDALARTEALRLELRNLRSRHDDAARAFEVNSGIGAVLIDWGLGWAEDEWGIPTGTARDEAERLRLTWTQSKQYRNLVTEFEQLLDRVRAELSPIFRGRLGLAQIYRAVNLVTKVRLLDAFLLNAEDRMRAWTASGKKLPVGRVRSARGTPGQRQRESFWVPRTLTEWVSLVSGVAVLLSQMIPWIVEGERNELLFPLLTSVGTLLLLLGIALVVLRSRRRSGSSSN